MSDLNADQIGTLVVEALERTAFVLAELPDEDEATSRFDPTHFAQIGFTGVAQGTLLLAADEPFLTELASSILGVEPEDVDAAQEGRDALSELANIVGGSVILVLGGADHRYCHGLPTTLAREQVPPETSDSIHSYIESECGLLRVTWMPDAAPKSAVA